MLSQRANEHSNVVAKEEGLMRGAESCPVPKPPKAGARRSSELSFTTVRRQVIKLNSCRLDPKSKNRTPSRLQEESHAGMPNQLIHEQNLWSQLALKKSIPASPRKKSPRFLERLPTPVLPMEESLQLRESIPEVVIDNCLQQQDQQLQPPAPVPDGWAFSDVKFHRLKEDWMTDTFYDKNPKARPKVAFLGSMLDEMLDKGAKELSSIGGWETVVRLLGVKSTLVDVEEAKVAMQVMQAVAEMEQGVFDLCFKELIKQEREVCKYRAELFERLRKEYTDLFVKMIKAVEVVQLVLERQEQIRENIENKEKEISSALKVLTNYSKHDQNKEDRVTIANLTELVGNQRMLANKFDMFHERERIEAAKTIQRAARRYQDYNLWKKTQLHIKAAIIQARARGRRARKRFSLLLIQKQERVHAMASIFYAVLRYFRKKQQITKKIQAKRNAAAIVIQSFARKMKAKRWMKLLKILKEAELYNYKNLRKYFQEIEKRTDRLESILYQVNEQERLQKKKIVKSSANISSAHVAETPDKELFRGADRIVERLKDVEASLNLKLQIASSVSRVKAYGNSTSIEVKRARPLEMESPLSPSKSRPASSFAMIPADASRSPRRPIRDLPGKSTLATLPTEQERTEKSTKTCQVTKALRNDDSHSDFTHSKTVACQTDFFTPGEATSLMNLQETLGKFTATVRSSREPMSPRNQASAEDGVFDRSIVSSQEPAQRTVTPAGLFDTIDERAVKSSEQEELFAAAGLVDDRTYASAGVVTQGFLDSLPCQGLVQHMMMLSKIELRAPKSSVWLNRFMMETISSVTEEFGNQGTLPSLQTCRDPKMKMKPMLGFFPTKAILSRNRLEIFSEGLQGRSVPLEWALSGAQALDGSVAWYQAMKLKTGSGVVLDQRILDFVMTSVTEASSNAMCRVVTSLLSQDRVPGISFFLHLHRLLAEIALIEKKHKKVSEVKKKARAPKATTLLNVVESLEEFLLLDYAAIRIDQATRIISEICGFEPQETALMMNAYINSEEEELTHNSGRSTPEPFQPKDFQTELLKRMCLHFLKVALPWPHKSWRTLNIYNPANEFSTKAFLGPEMEGLDGFGLEQSLQGVTETSNFSTNVFNPPGQSSQQLAASLKTSEKSTSAWHVTSFPKNYPPKIDERMESAKARQRSTRLAAATASQATIRPPLGNPSWQTPSWDRSAKGLNRSEDFNHSSHAAMMALRSDMASPLQTGLDWNERRPGTERAAPKDKFLWVVHVGDFCEICMYEHKCQAAAWKHAFWASVAFLSAVRKKDGSMPMEVFLRVLSESGVNITERELADLFSKELIMHGSPTMTYSMFYECTLKIFKDQYGDLDFSRIPYPSSLTIESLLKVYDTFSAAQKHIL